MKLVSKSTSSPTPTPTPTPTPPTSGGNPMFNPATGAMKPAPAPEGKKKYNFRSIFGIFDYMHHSVLSLNNSKFFAGIIMIMLNVGSKFISIQFSKSTEEYLKYTVTKQLLVFAMAWLGTRDIYTALILVAIFTILSDHLFNEESHVCVVPHKYRVLHTLDKSGDGLTEAEINTAMITLNKANRIMNRMKEEEDNGAGASKQGPTSNNVNSYNANITKT